ncbi:histidine--tRNA ligase [Crocinitomix catalasitica]|uniref:histidine--tRNA ligase n=1 Tax=Crocinitomix catalasitica TaxID=184607 RepID=UPI0004867B88|nr:histidine--tRNA ligase [Crocinitomix catalasitica]
MSAKPSIVKGTRDFLPLTMVKRNYIFSTIKNVFEKFGFLPIETPSMEKTETLMGKYGEEGDRLIFRVLNSGDTLKKADTKAFEEENLVRFANSLSEKALRYDLTVPFARYVVQNQNELSFPFKRFQIQPVWRADRPQKGRYREFYQCDADVVGSDSLIYEIELIQIFDEVLSKLGLTDFTIKINNRKILSGIAEVCGESEKLVPITVAIDKLDKIGKEGVVKELVERGISQEAITKIDPLFDLSGNNDEKIKQLEAYLAESEVGLKGIDELKFVLNRIKSLGLDKAKLELEVTLARGLNYYTGAIFEVAANNVKIGSICGGGRYDDLTALFGLKDMSGVGISFGADRIYDVMTELDLFPTELMAATQYLFINFGEKEQDACLNLAKQIRDKNVSCEVYPEAKSMKKQMKYANDRGFPYVILIGDNEMNNDSITLKNMVSGDQDTMSTSEFINQL